MGAGRYVFSADGRDGSTYIAEGLRPFSSAMMCGSSHDGAGFITVLLTGRPALHFCPSLHSQVHQVTCSLLRLLYSGLPLKM